MCRGLTLTQAEPRRPASYGASRRLRMTPSWPSAIAVVEERLRLGGRGGDQAADAVLLRHRLVEAGQALGERAPRSATRPRGAARRRRTGGCRWRRRGSRWSRRCPGRAAAARRRRARAPRRRGSGRSPAACGPTSTTSGSRAEISSSERVKTLTSSACLCTWMRMPSSLVSTTNGPPTFVHPRSHVGGGAGQHRPHRSADEHRELLERGRRRPSARRWRSGRSGR